MTDVPPEAALPAPQSPPLLVEPAPPAHPRFEPFVFTGKAGEYFGIWIVNLFLSVITLGIYSAWAKVRKKRYFYGHTWVAQSNFEYHGNPVAILKGRVLAFAAFLAYTYAGQFSPRWAALVLVALMPVVPWLIVRSLSFNAVNSSYRQLRFHFMGRYGEALVAVAPFFAVPIAGLFGPEIDPSDASVPADFWVVLLAPLLAFAFYPYVVGALKLLHVNRSRYGLARFDCRARIAGFYRIYVLAALLLVVLGMLFAMAMGVLLFAPFVGWAAAPVLYLVLGAVLLGYTRSRTTNLVMNATSLEGGVRLVSTLSARKLARLYAGNLVAIVFTLGLAIPWAAVRTARYRAECLALECASLEDFVADATRQVSATGEEMGEMFDVDLSL